MQPKGGCVCAMEQQEQPSKAKRLKIAIIILAVLLILSGGGLAARYIYLEYFAPAQITATVPDNLIRECVEAARLAPSACNKQPWRFYAVTSPELRETFRTRSDLWVQ